MTTRTHNRNINTQRLGYISLNDEMTNNRAPASATGGTETPEYLLVRLPESADPEMFRFALLSVLNALQMQKIQIESVSRQALITLLEEPGASSQPQEIKEPAASKIMSDDLPPVMSSQEKLRKKVIDENRWLSALEVSQLAGVSTSNPSAAPNRWKREQKTFAINIKGKDFYPEYGFNETGQPLTVMRKIISSFGENANPWSIAIWFNTPNDSLSMRRPSDLLTTRPDDVLDAAELVNNT